MASNSSTKQNSKPSGTMRIFVSYRGDRETMDISRDQTVLDVKEIVRELFSIGPDEGPSSTEVQERKVLSIFYAGSDLDNSWMITDIGISSGATLKARLKIEVKPSVFVFCSFNDEIVPLYDKINTRIMKVGEFRGLVSRKVGLPVGAFRILSKLEDGVEIYDCTTLDDYGINLGATVRLETWDGWNDLLNLSIMGFASHVMANLSGDEVTARYQMKVALYIAAHFGHVDLAVSLLRQGLRADEPIGEHPYRQWCRHANKHIDSLKAPVHESVEAGQLGVLRSFVHNNVCNVLAKDGNDLTGLNIALRRKQKACASFLLTKQWSKITYTKKTSIPLSIFVKMKRWAEKSKDKVLIIQGQWKSSIKNPRRHMSTGGLVGHGVQLDGFSKSKLNSKTAAEAKQEEEEEIRRKKPVFDILEEERNNRTSPGPEAYFRGIGASQRVKLPKVNKHGRMVTKSVHHQQDSKSVHHQQDSTTKKAEEVKETEPTESDSTQQSPESRRKFRPRSRSESRAESNVKLPPIKEKHGTMSKHISISHQNLTSGNKPEPEFQANVPNSKARSLYLKTPGATKQSVSSQPSIPESPRSRDKDRDKDTDTDTAEKTPRKRKDRSVSSAVMKAKARTDGGLALPVSSYENNPRPFMMSRSEELTRGTLTLYEKYRGIKSREYAIKCLTVANSFKDKPWLQQVHQAMIIAQQGVRRVVDMQPKLFQMDATRNATASATLTTNTTPSGTPSILEETHQAMATV